MPSEISAMRTIAAPMYTFTIAFVISIGLPRFYKNEKPP